METLQSLVGNTPMICIRYRFDQKEAEVFAKLEYYNLSGSIKDRIAYYIIKNAYRKGTLRSGQPIVEMTSGNTGIAFSAMGTLCKHPVHIFMPDWASKERQQLMKMFGARLHLVSREEGGFNAALVRSRLAAKEMGAFCPRQFENQDNPWAHYCSTGRELLQQLPDISDFVAGVGSGGTLMGVARRLKEDHAVRAVAVEPDAAALLSGATKAGEHRIEGIGDSFIPPVVDKKILDGVQVVNDLDAIAMANKLAKTLGIGVGISSGANFLGAVLQNTIPGRKVATVFADDNKKYLSTLLVDPPEVTDRMLTGRIELLDYKCHHKIFGG